MSKPLVLTSSLLALGLAVLAPTQKADANWSTYQHDAQLTGKASVAGPSNVGIKWSYQHPDNSLTGGGDAFTAGVAVGDDGTIYAAGEDGRAYAFNQNGSVKFIYPGVGVCCAPPVVGKDGTIYFSGNGLTALNPDFTLKWFYPDGGNCCGAITVADDGTIYVGNGWLHALDPNAPFVDPANPDPLLSKVVAAKWVVQAGDWAAAVTPDSRTIYAISGSSALLSINAADGSINWQYGLGNYLVTTPIISETGIVYISSNSSILAIDPSLVDLNAEDPWALAVRPILALPDKQVSFMAYDKDAVGGGLFASVLGFTVDEFGNMVYDADGELWAINAATGEVAWTQLLSGNNGSDMGKPVVDSRGVVYIETSDYADGVDYASHLYAFNGSTGEQIFQYSTPLNYNSDVRVPVIADNGYIYTLLDGALKAFAPVADIAVNLAATPNPIATNGNITYTATVSNAGIDSASNVTLKLILPSTLVNAAITDPSCTLSGRIINCSFGNLPATASTTLTVTGNASATGTTMSATAQIKTDSIDTNLTNNSVTLPVTVLAPPCDLVVTAVSGPAIINRGSSKYMFSATVRNQGTASCAASTLGFYLSSDNIVSKNGSDVLVGDAAVTSLAAGASKPVTLYTSVPIANIEGGSYYIGAYADRTSAVGESNENNNGKATVSRSIVN